MKIEMELKPGDIVLLKLLACLLIAFFMIRFLIFPGIEKHQDLQLEKEDLTAQQEEMQQTIDNAPNVEAKIKEQKVTLTEAGDGYYSLLENRELDELVTGIVLDHSLFPVYLNISETVPGVPAAYFLAAGSQVAAQTETEPATAEEELNGTAEDGTTQQTDASYFSYVNATEVNVTVRGAEEEIRSFIDDLAKNYPGIQVRSFQMQDSSYLNADWEMVESRSCNLVLAVYTCGGIDEMEETDGE